VLTRILYGYRTSLIACLLAVGVALPARTLAPVGHDLSDHNADHSRNEPQRRDHQRHP